ncbi:MAG: hypothetical protein HYY02_13305 [Chloroflexi bacterium]|nr:hypothetical protein [Chloroflexota bacterium]
MAQNASGETEAMPPRYHIQLSLFEAQGRSFAYLARQRMCPQSLARLGEEVEVRVPVAQPRSRKVTFQSKAARYGDDPIAVIQECCAKTSEYRERQLGLKEILFRLLLADGNRPKTAEELYGEVMEWVSFSDGRVITPQAIQRLLERDDFYCFAPVPEGPS